MSDDGDGDEEAESKAMEALPDSVIDTENMDIEANSKETDSDGDSFETLTENED